MKKVLILGVAPVQAEAIEKLKEMGYETHALAMKKDGPGADSADHFEEINICLLYTSPSPRDLSTSRMPSSA